MPLVTIKVFEGELSGARRQDLIRQITEAIVPFVGEKLRDNTLGLNRGNQRRILGNRGKSVRFERCSCDSVTEVSKPTSGLGPGRNL